MYSFLVRSMQMESQVLGKHTRQQLKVLNSEIIIINYP